MTTKHAGYYDVTAAHYDELHGPLANPEHTVAMELGWPLLGNVVSVLDVGAGTGRSLSWLEQRYPSLQLFGVDPSQGMIDIARRNLPDVAFKQGSGEALPYPDGFVDVAIATGIMHHVDNPSAVIAEMFRVARRGILISDHNNYAFGGTLMKRLRMGLKVCGLFGPVAFVRQGFNKKGYSQGDGWWYPYSLFDNYAEIAGRAEATFIFPTRSPTGSLGNLIYSQSHLCVVALKQHPKSVSL